MQIMQKEMQKELEKNIVINKIKELYQITNDQISSLEKFVNSILQQNLKYNFIGRSTIDDIWQRHILDCAQLVKFIEDKNKKFADFGSGCGLPGIVLSILGLKEIHLIEKSYRKSEFLRQAKHLSSNYIFVRQAKLEEIDKIKFDCITSRALAPLPRLLDYALKFLKKDGYCLFLKGKNLSQEIDNSKNIYNFEFEKFTSITSPQSNIIKIKNITKL